LLHSPASLNKKSLISIVPRLPPAIDGLGDYALSLARQLRINFGIESHFVVGDQNWSGGDEVEGFSIRHLKGRSAKGLLSILASYQPPCVVLLHYVGYGYARRGAPLWLINALEKWRTNNKNVRLFTIFHEVYASGPLWTSAYWLSPAQKLLAARLAQISDHCFTNRASSAELIKKLSRGKHTQVRSIPVFSNVGELNRPLSLAERPRKLMVFGTSGRRRQVYQRSKEILRQICQQLNIDEIFDVGRSLNPDSFDITNIRVTVFGEAPRETVSRLLSDSVIGFLDYPEELLGKSGIFAAYCAHRVLPIIASYGDAPEADGLKAGQHYWLSHFQVNELTLATGQRIADNAFEWYQSHSLPRQSEVFASYLMNDTMPSFIS
jgi:hypothetical protein